MGPGIIVLQEKSCVVWPDSVTASLQLRQQLVVVFRTDDLSGFQEIQKDDPFPIPKGIAHHLTCRDLHLELFFFFNEEFTCHSVDFQFGSRL